MRAGGPVPLVTVVAAVARNGVIGRGNALPWRLRTDLKRFKALTMGRPLLMGRLTYESIGRPLPGRPTVVVTRDPGLALPGARVAVGWEAALAAAGEEALRVGANEVMVVGGAQVYALALPLAARLALTEVDLAPDGDARFPAWDRAAWREVSREAHPAGEGDDAPFAFVDHERR